MKRLSIVFALVFCGLVFVPIAARAQRYAPALEPGSPEAYRAILRHRQRSEEAKRAEEAKDPRRWKPHVAHRTTAFRTGPRGSILGTARSGTYCDVTKWMTGRKDKRWVRVMFVGWVRESAVANLPDFLPEGKMGKPKAPDK